MQEITTKVDELLSILSRTDKMEVKKLSKQLGVPYKTLMDWIDFLVDEDILGIEYVFTTPYVYLKNKPVVEEEEALREKEDVTLEDFRKEFEKKALEKGIPKEKIPDLWRVHLGQALARKKEFFYSMARNKGFSLKEIHELWREYARKLLTG